MLPIVDEPAARDAFPAEVEAAIGRRVALADLDCLVDRGCVRQDLLVHLAVLRDTDHSLDAFAWWAGGLNRRQVKAAVQRIERSATEVERLTHTPVRALLAQNPQATALVSLPTTLRTCAAVLNDLLKETKRNHLTADLSVARLVRYVKECTGRFHDREVSALVSAVRPTTVDSPDAHKEWRRANYADLLHILQYGRRRPSALRRARRTRPSATRPAPVSRDSALGRHP